MSRPTTQAVCHVFIMCTDDNGSEYIRRYTAAHDGVRQSADEAIRSFWGYDRERLPPAHRIREILVFENVEPRRLQFEKIVRSDFHLREWPS